MADHENQLQEVSLKLRVSSSQNQQLQEQNAKMSKQNKEAEDKIEEYYTKLGNMRKEWEGAFNQLKALNEQN